MAECPRVFRGEGYARACVELCPYCEEDSALTPDGDCPRCATRQEVAQTAAYYAETVAPTAAAIAQVTAATAVLADPRDYPTPLADWARAVAGSREAPAG